jgi:NAD(P)-dependent dehydrogenase (short-subunit alcohol dehydrogenase family)
MGNISGAVTPNLKSDVFRKTIETNIMGTMLCVRAVTQVMMGQEPLSYTGRHGIRSLGRGSIINIGSVNSYVAAPGMLSYTTSKHAIIGITKSAGKFP